MFKNKSVDNTFKELLSSLRFQTGKITAFKCDGSISITPTINARWAPEHTKTITFSVKMEE